MIQKRLSQIRFEFKMIGFYIVYKLCKVFGYHLPLAWRTAYVMVLIRKITKSYKARPYLGPATLCQSESHSKNSGWANILAGDVQVQIIHGDHKHLDLYNNKIIISAWIDHLKKFIDQIQDSNLN